MDFIKNFIITGLKLRSHDLSGVGIEKIGTTFRLVKYKIDQVS